MLAYHGKRKKQKEKEAQRGYGDKKTRQVVSLDLVSFCHLLLHNGHWRVLQELSQRIGCPCKRSAHWKDGATRVLTPCAFICSMIVVNVLSNCQGISRNDCFWRVTCIQQWWIEILLLRAKRWFSLYTGKESRRIRVSISVDLYQCRAVQRGTNYKEAKSKQDEIMALFRQLAPEVEGSNYER